MKSRGRFEQHKKYPFHATRSTEGHFGKCAAVTRKLRRGEARGSNFGKGAVNGPPPRTVRGWGRSRVPLGAWGTQAKNGGV